MSDSTPLPWHKDLWEQLQQRLQQGRLPHAMLFHGPVGVGKYAFARALTQALICKSPEADGRACGDCPACHLYTAGNHPDLLLVTPGEGSRVIKVDQIRDLIDRLALSRHGRGYRCVIINPADRMNTAAANSLLKTLEEAPQSTLVMLLSSQPASLPATIRSRCQRLRFDLPQQAQGVDWLLAQGVSDASERLQFANGAPLLAIEERDLPLAELQTQLSQDIASLGQGRLAPGTLAQSILKGGEARSISWIYLWVSEAVKSRMTGTTPERKEAESLQGLTQQVDLQQLFGFLDRLQQVKGLLMTSVNKQLLVEGLLYDFTAMLRTRQ